MFAARLPIKVQKRHERGAGESPSELDKLAAESFINSVKFDNKTGEC